jgi:hypothetical protein
VDAGRVLDRHQVIADAPDLDKRADRFGGVFEKRLPERGIGPRLGDDPRADVRTDLHLVQLDDAIERRGLDVTLLDKNRFQRADAQVHFGKLRPFVMIVIVRGHEPIYHLRLAMKQGSRYDAEAMHSGCASPNATRIAPDGVTSAAARPE